MAKHRLDPDKYTVGWVSALPIELAAAKVMLDEEHGTETGGSALYTLGRIGDHNVVLGCLPAGQMGTSSAAVVGTLMKEKYKAIRFGMMVGIGGGVPSGESDIRLGDVVVSQPHLEHGGVIQYDYGKETTKGFVRTGSLSPPPAILLNALARLRADHYVNISGLSSYFTPFYSLPNFGRDRAGPDLLFNSSYEHVAGATCDGCNRNETINRRPRGDLHAEIHYGTIASGNQVIKRAIKRDELSSELGGILCFEMEAAGLMNTFPCLVIRGICDYADSHKNKAWQPYAAATAAACAKALINIIPDDDVRETLTTAETTYVRPTERKLRMTQVEKSKFLLMTGFGKTLTNLKNACSRSTSQKCIFDKTTYLIRLLTPVSGFWNIQCTIGGLDGSIHCFGSKETQEPENPHFCAICSPFMSKTQMNTSQS